MKLISPKEKITFLINPIEGCKINEPFEFTTTIENVELEGLAHLLIEADYWQSMGHPCYHFDIDARYMHF